jgi:hypothetical protein
VNSLVDRQLLVYVQALPSSIGHGVRNFKDLEGAEFRLSHSSKTALSFAASLGFHEIVAAGYAPVLNEAIARGATSVASLPLCDDPVKQAQFFPEEEFTHVLIGENLDWIFSGASLLGVFAHKRNMKAVLSTHYNVGEFPRPSIILVKDPGENAGTIDVRKIKSAMEVNLNSEAIIGDVSFQTFEAAKTESISGAPSEIASSLSRKIRRFVDVSRTC